MRWVFLEPSATEENAERAVIVDRIDNWWRAFGSKIDELTALFSRRSEWDLPDWMHRHLHAIDERLMWEFGQAVSKQGHRLVITPETQRQLRPMVDEILRRAPKIDGWEFYSHRLPEAVEDAQAGVEGRCGGSIEGWRVHAAPGEQNRIDLRFFVPGLRPNDDELAMRQAFVATEALVGEALLDRWIGRIEAAPAEVRRGLFGKRKSSVDGLSDAIPIAGLRDAVTGVIERIRGGLPDQPHYMWSEKAQWTLMKLSPEDAPDYTDQDDLFVAKTPNLSLWAASRSGSFFDERFTRCGERFCYVKIDGSEGTDECQFADKAEIEDALDAALRPAGLGCQIGGGTGRRYSYIELALTDLTRGLQVVRERLREGKAPRRTWLLFHNDELRGEWVGVYEDGPAPMMSG